MNSKNYKQIFIISVIVFFTGFLVYDYYTNNCSVYNKFFLVNQSVIDKKYVYTVHEGKIEGSYAALECNKIKYIQKYYLDFNESYINNITSGIGYIRPYRNMEILKYNLKDSLAFVKIYNTIPRAVKEDYTIVSMKCLHDTLPAGMHAIE